MANSYLSKTAASGNRRTWTFSAWVKRSGLTADNSAGYDTFFSADEQSTNSVRITFSSDSSNNRLMVYYYTGSMQLQLITNREFRDTSAWYHIVVQVDTTQGTASDRAKIYVNGIQETSFATATYPSQNTDTSANQSGAPHEVGRGGGNLYFNGYLSHVALVDGTVVAPTEFGETDSTSGIWKFKSPTGLSWGTNGFHLKFENSAALGTDSSGQGNNYTVNGNLKQALDTPSNVHATFNPLSNYWSNQTFSYGNNKIVSPGDRHDFAISTLGMNVGSGKYYAEFKLVAAAGSDHCVVGISDHSYMGSNEELSQENYSIAYVNGGTLRSSGTNAATGVGTYTAGDIIGVAVDMDNLKIYWHKNGTYVNSGVPTSGSTGTGAVAIHNIDTSPNSNSRGQGTYFFAAGNWHSGASSTWEANFGNGFFGTTAITSAGSNGNGSLFEYDVPSGYYALNTKNINTYG